MKKEKLQAIRKKKGYTQQQVADFIPTDVSNYSRKESGDVKIFNDEWEKIASFLEVPVEDIYEADDNIIFPEKARKQNTKIDLETFYQSIIKDLQNYIALLKAENDRLRK